VPSYRHSYLGLNWRDFLHAEEELERHLLHQVGHVWLAESFGATLTALKFDHGGTSKVTLNGRLTSEQQYQVAVAGMLAEAKGIVAGSRREPQLDVDRMAILAQRILAEVSARPSGPGPCFLVEIPLTTRIPSRETAGCSVGDFNELCQQGLEQTQLLRSLRHVAAIFNVPKQWAEYLSLVEELRP
jgi:hypothetical protein